MKPYLSRRIPHHRWAHFLTYLWLILWMSSLLPVAPVAARPLPVQPELLEIAASEPDALVDVIVQQSSHDGRVEQQIAQLGGTITQELGIINGLAAQLPARAATALGALPGVRWVSLNNPVESHSSAQTRYYLYSAKPGEDSISQPVLPFSQVAPSTKELRNYDTDRDAGPGLLIRRSNAADATVQRWRLGPFTDDMWLSGNGYLQLYVAAPEFRKDQTVRIQADLLHLDANGQQLGVIASNGHTRKWYGRWQGAKMRFNGLNYFFEAGHYLELALTVDPISDDDIWLAFGTRTYPAHLSLNLQYALLSANTFYLANEPREPTGDTLSQPVLPLTYRKPATETLYNYDTDRDNGPGLVLQRGGAYDSDSASGMIQRWRLKPFLATTQMAANAQVELYAAVKQFQVRNYGKIWAHLIHRNERGELVKVIASGSVESADWGTTWQRRTIRLHNPTYAFPAGHQLELALTVDADSAQAMWIAYGASPYPSLLRASFLPLLPQYFLDTIGAPIVWSKGYEGQGVRVAVIDSGIQTNAQAFMEIGPEGARPRIIESVGIGGDASDYFGHGTFVAGVIGGNGAASGGYYKGVAPKVDLINVRVSDEWGAARESDVIAGMQWVLEHKDEYNIRVVNMSLNSAAEQPYHLSPLDAAAEILWFNG
ncbi:MAG TPA: S8 family serine peptidase, partial [Caldilineaceae bacterium]|nr:S8 family serine peptidase [Caldilineaceae bacterium]